MTIQNNVLKYVFEKKGRATTNEIMKYLGINRNQVHKAITHLKFRGLVRKEKPKSTFPKSPLNVIIPNNQNVNERVRRLIYGETEDVTNINTDQSM